MGFTMWLEPKTIKNTSGLLPEILHRILGFLNSTDLINLKESGSDDLKEVVDESIAKRENTCRNTLVKHMQSI